MSYGSDARKLIKSKQALPICANKNLAFGKVEITTRGKKNQIKTININQLKNLPFRLKKEVLKKIRNITQKRKNIRSKS